MLLDANQSVVLEAATGNSERNILLLGYAGTGKTTVAKEIAAACPGVVLTSMTVLGAGEAQCRTFSSFLSVFVGEPPHNVDKLFAELLEKPGSLKHIRDCRTLIIDNASMLTSRMFKLANELFQQARGNSKLFGGMRLILVADPYGSTVPRDIYKYPVQSMPVHFFDSPNFLSDFNGTPFFLERLYRPLCDLLSQAVIGSGRGILPIGVLNALKARCLGAAGDEKSPSLMRYNQFQNLGGTPRNKKWQLGNIILCAWSAQAAGIHDSLKKRKERKKEKFVEFMAKDVVESEDARAELHEKPALAKTVFFTEGTQVFLAKDKTLRCSQIGELRDVAGIQSVDFHKGELAVVVEFFRQDRVGPVRKSGREVWGSFDGVDEKLDGAVLKTRRGYFVFCALDSETLVAPSGRLQRTQFPFVTAAAISVPRSVGVSAENVYLVDSSETPPAGFLYSAISKVKTLENLFFDVSFDIEKYISLPKVAVRDFLHSVFPARNLVDMVSRNQRPAITNDIPAIELGSKRTFDEVE